MVLMARRPTERESGVTLWLIPQVVLQWIRRVGEDLEWIHIRRSCRNLFDIRIRLRPLKRGFRHQRVIPIPEEAL
jgi:hypothetical protein